MTVPDFRDVGIRPTEKRVIKFKFPLKQSAHNAAIRGMTHDCSEWESICSCHLSVAAGAHELCASIIFCVCVPAASDGRQSRELEVGVLQRDRAQSMCALSFLRLEEMMDNQNNNQEIRLEPRGVLHAKVTSSGAQGLRTNLDKADPAVFHLPQLCFINTVAERQPRLRRQRCIFTKERG